MAKNGDTPDKTRFSSDCVLPNGVPLRKATFADFSAAIEYYESQAAARAKRKGRSRPAATVGAGETFSREK